MSEPKVTTEKPVPDEPQPMPALDHTRTQDANLAPQGTLRPDGPPDAEYTPEGDNQRVPNIPPSATDPVE